MQGLINITNEEKRQHRREYQRNYYHNVRIPNGYAEQRKDSIDKSVSKKQQFINQLKIPCQKCGIADKDIIEFHHIDPNEKKFNLGSAVWKTNQAIEAEAAECVCLCANCHKKFHSIYGIKPDYPVEQLSEFLQND